jgi:septum formation protein
MENILYIGTSSASRQQLLKEAEIPFEIVEQSADERACDWGMPLPDLLKTIAVAKMDHVILQQAREGEVRFVLTADTMSTDADGVVHGKPASRADAIAKIKTLRRGGVVATAFCLDKKIWQGGAWHTQERILECVSTTFKLDMPDVWIERYLEAVPYFLNIGGAYIADGYGAQFLQEINGSFTTILGLPMCQVRRALERVGYFKNPLA